MNEFNPRAAVPWHVGNNFNDCPPGHRFLLYLPFWGQNWDAIKDGKQNVLKCVGAIPDYAKKIMGSLASRQIETGKKTDAECIGAVSRSPFATGLGWEHPNENGFAFLHPYGLPYLAGSGVKGVLRRAAQELGDTRGWTEEVITDLFGLEPPSGSDEASCGALRFFDVIPEIAGNLMGVEIMNPHYGDYYQNNDNASPHDAGQPMPIFFLVVPPGSEFTFVVDCPRQRLLPNDLQTKWRELIRSAFEHAFDWLGFGAKTAVGYGQMRELTDKEKTEQTNRAADSLRCDWVDKKIRELTSTPGIKADDALRGKALADAWYSLTDKNEKRRALDDIVARWKANGYWDNPTSGALKKAYPIYKKGMEEMGL